MPEWISTTVGDVLTLQRGFDITRPEQRAGAFPVVSSGGVKSYHDTAINDGPGVVIGRKGALNRTYYLPGPYWPHDTTLWVKDFKGSVPRFVYYFFRNLDVSGLDVGSANPTLNRNHVHPLPVTWPPVVEQQRISEILGALDDKISLNERIASSCRELGTAEFAGEVGSGAQMRRIGDLAEFLARGVAPKYSDDKSGLIVLNQKCIRGGRVSLGPARRCDNERVQVEKYIHAGDVLVNSTGAGTLGRVAIWPGNSYATVDSHVTIVRFAAGHVDPMCAAYAMLLAQSQIENLGEGSTGQTELSRHNLADLKITVPTPEKCAKLGEKIAALESRGEKARSESAALAGLRDELLPKLMSGEIRVRDAEMVVEDVT